MQQVTLTKVFRNTTAKDGRPLVSKQGKPYTSVSIKTTEHGERYLSGFGGPWNQNWNEGDVVDIEVKENGQYLNFEKPDPIAALSLEVAGLKIRIAKLEQSRMPQSLALPEVPSSNTYQEPEPDLSQIPF